MVHLRKPEIDALRWLAKEFPIGAVGNYKDWNAVVEGLRQSARIETDAECEATVALLRGHGLFDGKRLPNNMFTGSITAGGIEQLRASEELEGRERNQAAPPRLFLSHSHLDYEMAEYVKQRMEEFSLLQVFVAHKDIRPSEEWRDSIIQQLEECDVFVALLTSNFASSDWTDQETGIAIAMGRRIIPVWVDVKPYGFLERYQAFRWDSQKRWESIVMLTRRLLELGVVGKESLLQALENAQSFQTAGVLAELLAEHPGLNDDDVNRIVRAVVQNHEVRNSFAAQKALRSLISKTLPVIEPSLAKEIPAAFLS